MRRRFVVVGLVWALFVIWWFVSGCRVGLSAVGWFGC